MPITSFPPAPSGADPATFADKADAYLAHLENPFVAQANALEANVNAKEASTNALSLAAVNAVNISAWVSGTTYAVGVTVYDPVDLLSYRRSNAGAGTTRPGLDNANWVVLNGLGNVRLDTNQTFTGVNTFAQPINGSGANLTDLDASNLSSGTVPAARLPAATETAIGALEIATAAEAQAGTSDTVAITPLKIRQCLNASGTAPIYACRAWVNFNAVGTVTILASGNVSSITDNGVGDFTLNFTNAMPDVNYTFSGGAFSLGNASLGLIGANTMSSKAASSFRFVTATLAFQAADYTNTSVNIFR